MFQPRPVKASSLAIVAFALLIAIYAGRTWWVARPGWVFWADDTLSNYLRFADFYASLKAGSFFPQWSTFVRGGLGEPQFTFYQPGLFYLGSLFVPFAGLEKALALALMVVSLLGFAGTYVLVGSRAGRLAGVTAAGTYLCSFYVTANINVRGDFTEYTAMMVLPAFLHFFLRVEERNDARDAVKLAIAGAAILVSHPCIALLAYGGAALATLLRRPRALGTWLALGAGPALAAAYVLPVFWEMHWIRSPGPGADFHQYFIPLASLFAVAGEPRDLPFTLGIVGWAVLALFVAMLVHRRRRLTAAERTLAIAVPLGSAAAMFLMLRWSAPVWETLPFLRLLLFPCRLLTLLSLFAAVAAGLVVAWTPRRLAPYAMFALLAASGFASMKYRALPKYHDSGLHGDVRSLATIEYFPDYYDEWVPRGAIVTTAKTPARQPWSSGGCRVTGISREIGALAVTLEGDGPCRVVLPQYHYPVGWSARLGGTIVPLSGDADGLLVADVPAPAQGRLEVRFSMTPSRRWGLALSACSIIGLAFAFRRRRWPRDLAPANHPPAATEA